MWFILIIIFSFWLNKTMINKFVILIRVILLLLKTNSYCNFSVAVCVNSTNKHLFFWKIILNLIIFRRIFILIIAWLWFYFYIRPFLFYFRGWFFFNFFKISVWILNFFKLILSLLINPNFIQIFSFFTYKCLICNFIMFRLITKFLNIIFFPN